VCFDDPYLSLQESPVRNNGTKRIENEFKKKERKNKVKSRTEKKEMEGLARYDVHQRCMKKKQKRIEF